MNNHQPTQGFFYWGLGMLLVSVVAFIPSYFSPLINNTSIGPIKFVHWHAVFVMLWLLLLVIQPWLVSQRKIKLHQVLGVFGISIAIGVIYTSLMVQVQFMHHYFNLNELTHAVKVPFFRLMTLLVFTACVVLSLVIKDRSWHKRLIFLGSFAILEAAFARLFLNYMGVIELSGLLGALTHVGVMVFFVIWDRIELGRFHMASLWGSLVISVLIFGSAPIADSQWWFNMAQSLSTLGAP